MYLDSICLIVTNLVWPHQDLQSRTKVIRRKHIVQPKGHDDVIKWKHFPRYWSFVRGIHRSPVDFPHKGQWRGALMFSVICAWTNGWANTRYTGDLRRHRAHYDVTAMVSMPITRPIPNITDNITLHHGSKLSPVICVLVLSSPICNF